MRWRWHHYLLAFLAVAIPVVVVLWPSTAEGAPAMSLDHSVGSQGFVEADPSALARAAGVSLNVYALASMMASEAGGENAISQVAIACVAVNHAKARGESISRLLLRCGKNTVPGDHTSFVADPGNGHFGLAAHRYASTRRPPSAAQLDTAAQILSGEIVDPTGGATRFDTPDPSLENVDSVASKRQAAGLELVTVDGVDAFRFWRSA